MALVVCFVIWVDSLVYQSGMVDEDIYYAWVEGKRIASGENPYARILSGDMRMNQKYATYFPLFYVLSALTQGIGFEEYPQWISLWHRIFLGFEIGIGLTLFYVFHRLGMNALGFFSSLFWLFNRWTLEVVQIGHMDFIPLFFLIASLLSFRKHAEIALLLFSLSLGLKQIAVFLAPLYLVWIWHSPGKRNLKTLLSAMAIMMSVPALASLPFILWDAEGFFKSILFSVTRYPSDHFQAASVDVYLGLIGIPAKVPMLLLMTLVYYAALRRSIGMYTAALLVMFAFIDFNSVLFRQYMCWVVPLIPLSICDVLRARGNEGNENPFGFAAERGEPKAF